MIVVSPSGFGGNCEAMDSKRQAHRRIERKAIGVLRLFFLRDGFK